MISDDNKTAKSTVRTIPGWQVPERQTVAQGPVVGDFELMKEMGVNTVRITITGITRSCLQDLYQTYGIR